MTQIERIIHDGIVDKDFLKEEIIYDFKVTQKLKKIQAIALDMLLKFDSVCKKHNLNYFLAFGTLLGAVRHKGFIPWDEDLDVLMPREDYERFIHLSEDFEHPYFLQTPETDKGYLGGIARIRNSETCGFHHYWGPTGYNSGLWIDVFPLDNCKMEDREEMFNKIDYYNSYNSAFMKIAGNKVNEKGRNLLLNNLDLSPKASVAKIRQLAQKYKNQETQYVTVYVSTGISKWDRLTWEKSCFAKSIEMDYCGYTFPGPIGYDMILRTTYGNYMEFPPLEERDTRHPMFTLDPDKPYLVFFAENGIVRT